MQLAFGRRTILIGIHEFVKLEFPILICQAKWIAFSSDGGEGGDAGLGGPPVFACDSWRADMEDTSWMCG